MKKILIVGAGPAGLGAAHYFSQNPYFDVTVIDKGKNIEDRIKSSNSSLLFGLGGAGGFSDGKLNIHQSVGGNLANWNLTKNQALNLLNYLVEHIYAKNSPEPLHKIILNESENEQLEKKAKESGLRYKPIQQIHIGSDNLPKLIANFRNELISKGVKFKFETDVSNLIIDNNHCKGIKYAQGEEYGDEVILSAGRAGQNWIQKICKDYNINISFGDLELGLRIEIPNKIYEEIEKISYDPKIIIPISDQVKVRTFCTNPSGFVVLEDYSDFVGVNGHSFKHRKSNNTNFALVTALNKSQNVNSAEYATKLLKNISDNTGKKAILQSYINIKNNAPGIGNSITVPTLREHIYENISDYYPAETLSALITGLEKLNLLIPDLCGSNTLVYAPEVKFRQIKVQLNENLESSVKNLYFAGDCTGLVCDIIHSTATGWLIAEKITSKYKTSELV